MMKKIALITAALMMFCMVLCGCGAGGEQTSTADGDIYLTLVNKTHKLPDDWTDRIELVTGKNSMDEEFTVEKEALAHYEDLREALLKEDLGIALDSLNRPVAEEGELCKACVNEYGEN